jgi:nucleoside-diphosphate-sugar epimerase
MDLAILRFAEIFGCSKSQTSGSMVNFLVDHMLVGNGIGLFGVTAQKDHVHISDATRALLLAVEDTETPVCNVDIGPGVGETIQDVVEKVKKMTGFKGPLQYLQDPAVRVVDSVSDPLPAKELWGFECAVGDFETQLSDLVKKRRKDLR